jgi:putative ABC transport system ATP-binding protein
VSQAHTHLELITTLNRDNGIAVIMVTHESAAAVYAHRVVHMFDGLVQREVRNGEAH